MKFTEFLTLKEDGEGGDSSGATAVTTSSEGDITNNIQSTEDAIPLGNTTANMAGYPAILGYYSRIKMPQIPQEMYGEFINDLKLNNIKHKTCNYKACELVPTQAEFNPAKVASIKASIADKSYIHSPLLVAGDQRHIVDGHHRWAAFDDNDHIPVNHVDLSFEDLYDFLQNKPYVLNRDVKQ